MTTLNYSISGLKDLLSDLENLSTCISCLPRNHVSPSVLNDLIKQQHDLIEFTNGYCTMLQSLDKKTSLLEE
jgi:hypothetical protein